MLPDPCDFVSFTGIATEMGGKDKDKKDKKDKGHSEVIGCTKKPGESDPRYQNHAHIQRKLDADLQRVHGAHEKEKHGRKDKGHKDDKKEKGHKDKKGGGFSDKKDKKNKK